MSDNVDVEVNGEDDVSRYIFSGGPFPKEEMDGVERKRARRGDDHTDVNSFLSRYH